MAAAVTKLETQRGSQRPAKAGGPTVRAAIDGFLDSPDAKANPNTLRAYTSVLDRVAEEIGSRRKLAEVHDDEIAGALTELWDNAKPATWNRNRAAVGSWLAWAPPASSTGPRRYSLQRRSGAARRPGTPTATVGRQPMI